MRAAPALLVIALAAAPVLARDSAVPTALPTGPAVACIQQAIIDESFVRSSRVIDFRVLGNHYYRNTLPHDCAGLGSERRFSYSSPISKLCSTDIITVISVGSIAPGNSCRLGPFQPVTFARH